MENHSEEELFAMEKHSEEELFAMVEVQVFFVAMKQPTSDDRSVEKLKWWVGSRYISEGFKCRRCRKER
jgi:hypothetical protein